MTYQLSRLRLASVGDRAARFTDLTLDMSSSEITGQQEPIDSILWLRNGGGKSSLLSLFFALLLPLRRDFMGRSVKRYLEDYVATGDTSHTVAEWVAQSDGGFLPPPRLITGAVYEWVDRRKPVDPTGTGTSSRVGITPSSRCQVYSISLTCPFTTKRTG